MPHAGGLHGCNVLGFHFADGLIAHVESINSRVAADNRPLWQHAKKPVPPLLPWTGRGPLTGQMDEAVITSANL